MITIALPNYTGPLPNLSVRGIQACCYVNDELVLELCDDVLNQECMIIGSPRSPEDLITLSLLADTLKREGASKITTLLPYLAYTRQDKSKPGQSLGIAWLGNLLKSSGIDSITSVDVHSTQAIEACPVPVRSLSPARIFAEQIDARDAIVVAPDAGARERAKALANAAKVERLAVMTKEHSTGGIRHSESQISDGKRAIIVDDILDTGATLVSCCHKLKEQGIQEIEIAVTHGLFMSNQWQTLWDLGVKKIYVSDSLPLPKSLKNETRIKVCTIRPLLTVL